MTEASRNAHARRTDPLTSHLAAATASSRLNDVQGRVLHLLRSAGPQTDEKLIRLFRHYWAESAISDQSIRSRRAELVRKGLVVHTGEFGTSGYGQKARLWRAV